MSTNVFKVHSAEEIINSSLLLIRKFDWLLNLSVVNYFNDKHWEKLPAIWQDALQDLEPPEFATLLDLSRLKRQVWPLSLLSLKASAARFSLPRYESETLANCSPWRDICFKCKSGSRKRRWMEIQNELVDKDRTCHSEFTLKGGEVDSTDKYDSILSIPITSSPCLTHPKLKHVFKKHVKQKKRHEIEEFSKVVARTAQSVNCKHVIDIGSGVGHLSRMLAYGYGLKVCGVEGSESLSKQAICMDLEFEATISKHLTIVEMKDLTRPVHLILMLGRETKREQFIQSICAAFGGVQVSDFMCGIIGLHTCGDLAPILLQLFADCPNISFVNSVGCCFMKLSTQNANSCVGYPMSGLLSKRPDSDLSYDAMEVSCHANEIYWQRLCDGQFADLKVNCYRAALEEILARRFPSLQHAGIASVKCTPQLAFADYCSQALSKHNVKLATEDVNAPKTLQSLSEWKRVVNVSSLRLVLAPVVETVILLDRLLYLREKGFNSLLTPVFDPKVSPRNHVIVATKR